VRGHGTHVCGTVAGRADCGLCGIAQYDGVAPDAKLHVSDVGDAQIPGDLTGEIDLDLQAETIRSLGGHVTSNSWSFDEIEPEARMIYDSLAWEYPDIAYVFAAGNDHAWGTINVPSDAKNILTVGATTQASGGQAEWQRSSVVVVAGGSSVSGFDATRNVWQKSVADPADYVVDAPTTTSTVDCAGKVVLLEALDCLAVSNVQSRGGLAVILSSDTADTCPDVQIPVVSRLAKPVTAPRVSIFPYEGSNSSSVSVSRVSSKGPARSGLRKPDIGAPGDRIISAYSHGPNPAPYDTKSVEAALGDRSGTSMATPAVSGSLAVICQFLEQKWYPHFRPGDGVYVHPHSHLLKAMLAAATESRFGWAAGYGVPNLSSLLLYHGQGVRIVPNVAIESDSHHLYNLVVQAAGQPLIVSLAYLDPPLDPSYLNPLFADIDLVVVHPNGQAFFGNGRQDSLSTVEKVIIDNVTPGRYELHVISSEFPLPQRINYSMVIRGPFNHSDFTSNPVIIQGTTVRQCLPNCANCVEGKCLCAESRRGHSCQDAVALTSEDGVVEVNLAVGVITYIKLVMQKSNGTGSDAYLALTHVSGDARARLFGCWSAVDASSIASPDWTCFEAKFGDNWMGLGMMEDVYLALYLGSYEQVRLAVQVRLGERHVLFDHAGIVGIVVLALCLFSVAAILSVEYSRRPKREPHLAVIEEGLQS
jgi:subtilisin family serine protease